MSNQTPGVQEMLFGLLRRTVSLRQFEAWVYATDELEQKIGFERDEELLGFDYRQPKAQELLDELLLESCERHWPAEHEREVARRYLCGLVAGTGDIFEACYWLAARHRQGAGWIPSTFVDLDLALMALEELGGDLELYRGEAQQEAARLLAGEFPNSPCQ